MTDTPGSNSTSHDDDFDAALDSVRRAIEQFQDCSNEERFELQHDLDELTRQAMEANNPDGPPIGNDPKT